MLALDEICDGGVFLEADPTAVVSRVALRTDDIPLGEQTVAQVKKSIFIHSFGEFLSSKSVEVGMARQKK